MVVFKRSEKNNTRIWYFYFVRYTQFTHVPCYVIANSSDLKWYTAISYNVCRRRSSSSNSNGSYDSSAGFSQITYYNDVEKTEVDDDSSESKSKNKNHIAKLNFAQPAAAATAANSLCRLRICMSRCIITINQPITCLFQRQQKKLLNLITNLETVSPISSIQYVYRAIDKCPTSLDRITMIIAD